MSSGSVAAGVAVSETDSLSGQAGLPGSRIQSFQSAVMSRPESSSARALRSALVRLWPAKRVCHSLIRAKNASSPIEIFSASQNWALRV